MATSTNLSNGSDGAFGWDKRHPRRACDCKDVHTIATFFETIPSSAVRFRLSVLIGQHAV